ncbi:MAG: F0F1 ATP synthase subunit B [Pseudomonadota bacterium]
MEINFTLIGEMITFALFVWFTMKFIWPPVTKAMADRQKKIADGLEAAEHGKNSLEIAKKKASQMLTDTRKDSSQIIDEANARASKIVDEAKARATQEGQQIIVNAQSEIDLQVERTKEVLRKEVVDIAMMGASKILSKDVDKTTHKKLLDELISAI